MSYQRGHTTYFLHLHFSKKILHVKIFEKFSPVKSVFRDHVANCSSNSTVGSIVGNYVCIKLN